MPALLLWLAMLLPMATSPASTRRSPRLVLSARLLGRVAGVAPVPVVSTEALGVAVGPMVLLSVLLTARAVVIPVNRGGLVAAGLTSGTTGPARYR